MGNREQLASLLVLVLVAMPLGAAKPVIKQDCRAVSFEGSVKAGEAYRKRFAGGMEFFLEPLKSGWIVRVLAMRGAQELREPHDYAEVATPPYRSVSPLLISTDWAFRAQDAAGWNPREFRYARDAKMFSQLSGLYDGVLWNDAKASSEAAGLVMSQPEGRLKLLDVVMVPGTQDQARMAAAVASHFEGTQHEVLQGEKPTPLGRLAEIRFSVTLDLPGGAVVAPGVSLQHFSCKLRPTV